MNGSADLDVNGSPIVGVNDIPECKKAPQGYPSPQVLHSLIQVLFPKKMTKRNPLIDVDFPTGPNFNPYVSHLYADIHAAQILKNFIETVYFSKICGKI